MEDTSSDTRKKRKVRVSITSEAIRPYLLLALVTLCFALMAAADAYQPDRDAVLNHLNAMISWYRDSTTNVQAGNRPSDTIFATNAQTLASQALSLAFDSAKAEAVLLGESTATPNSQQSPSSGNNSGTTPANGNSPAGERDYSQMQARVSQRISDSQNKIEALNTAIAASPAAKRQALLSQRDALTGEISLDKAMLDAIGKMASFAESNNSNKKSFQGSINALANSVPEVVGRPSGQKTDIQKPVPVEQASHSNGLLGQLASLYDDMENLRSIDRLLSENSRVHNIADRLRQPLLASLRDTIQAGQDAATQSGSATGAGAQATTSQFTKLTQQFNQLSGALVPLSEELMVLDESRSNLTQWRTSISSESKRGLFSVLTRVIAIALALGVVLLLSEIWRRLTFRYISEPRRRRQFLVLRRLLTGFFLSMVVIMGFVSEFSSLATYAGFVTAGIAVGLQTVLLSVAAYFFVIGRYGIRVGDRISVAGVTGDVIDVGLVRIYLMEVSGTGIDLHPTGRIAVFSNSVLFQPTTPLFKQVPGTEYSWHEIALALAPGGDHKLVQEKMLGIVNSIYDRYRKDIEHQQGIVGDRMEIALRAPVPEATLQLDDTGFSLVIRYPVELRRASDVDGSVAATVIDAINGDEALKKGISGTPKVRAVVKA